MSPPKKIAKSSRRPARLNRAFSFLWGPGRPATIAVLLVVALAGAFCAVWYTGGVGEYVLGSDEYLIGPHDVVVTPQPAWIQTDIRAEVFRSASLDGKLSLMDDDLCERIDNAFSLHPWVANVGPVRKSHPARVLVELLYRRPVCMVMLSGELLPVDAQGVLLPRGDFSPVEASHYPRLVGIETAPVGTVGECWGDVRVVGGAEVAAALGEAWGPLDLAWIVPVRPPGAGVAEEHTYVLVTHGGTRIRWGRAPGSGAPGEVPAAEKVARLKGYAQEHGTLEGPGAPQELDVQEMHSPRVSPQPAM